MYRATHWCLIMPDRNGPNRLNTDLARSTGVSASAGGDKHVLGLDEEEVFYVLLGAAIQTLQLR